MQFKQKRKIQQLSNNSLSVTIPKSITLMLDLKKGNELVFEVENEEVKLKKQNG